MGETFQRLDVSNVLFHVATTIILTVNADEPQGNPWGLVERIGAGGVWNYHTLCFLIHLPDFPFTVDVGVELHGFGTFATVLGFSFDTILEAQEHLDFIREGAGGYFLFHYDVSHVAHSITLNHVTVEVEHPHTAFLG